MVYNIVCVADEKYAQHASVMLESLFETNKDKTFCIFFMTYSLTDKTKGSLLRQCNRFNSQITFIETEYPEIKDFKVGQWNSIMYLKLLTPQYIPEHIDRYLFLDVDMIINADIEPLYNHDLRNKTIAACEDIPDCLLHKTRLGIPVGQTYVNSGVMVVNLERWRNRKYTWIEQMQLENVDFINDQDVVAMYFKGEIDLLPIKWNMVTFYYMRKPKIFEKYLTSLYYDKRHPCIVHFACPIKPWFKDCRHPFGSLYKKYLQKTEWSKYEFPYFEKLSKWGRTKKCVRNIFNRIGILKDDMYLIE